MAAFAHITSLLNTIHFHFLQPLPCLIFDDTEIIGSLCEKIRYLQAFLEDSEKKNKARRALESEIRGVAHDAETKIESQLYQLYHQVEHPLKPPQSLYHTLQQVKRKMESIERRIIKVESNGGNHSVERQRRNTLGNFKAGSFSAKNIMVGCDDEFDTIMHKLISHSKQLQVISIVGMGGIGKTTLIRRVYEDATVISHFDVRAWVTVTQEHKLREMLISLLDVSIITNDADDSHLANQLRQKLMGKRYLVVVDDIWSTQAWDNIHRCFPREDLNGSRILLTSRLKHVAEYANSGNNNPHYMRFLNPNESWSLFYKKVFEEKKVSLEFETVGRGIVEKCQGLPLTIIVVAGLLTSFNKPSLNQWENIVENFNSLLHTDPEEKCSKILSLSYNHLPLHLKICFLYFGVFPEDSEIRVKRLIRLWVAEGFLKLELNNNMEEVAQAYLHDLIDRGLVQIDKWSSDNKIKSCRLHDLLHSFCLKEAQSQNLLYVEVTRVDKLAVGLANSLVPKAWTQKLASKYRMFMKMSKGLDQKSCRWITCQLSRLDMAITRHLEFRSFLYFPKQFGYSSSHQFPYAKLLRVLDISVCEGVNIPSDIVNLVHLRYLALTSDGFLEDFQWLKLQSLLTFIIRVTGVNLEFGSLNNILDMPQIRHVHFGRGHYLNFPKLVQENLQTISWLSLPLPSEIKPDFKMMPNVKELGIYLNINPNSMTLCEGTLPYAPVDGLADLCKLENLKIAATIRSHIFRCDIQLPTTFPPNLKKLTLWHTHLPWKDMTILGTLPNLEVLKLKMYAFLGKEWKITEDGFHKLKYLQIVGSDLEHWSVAADQYFSILGCLILGSCVDLKEFPTEFVDINTLQLIELSECQPSLVTSAKQIQEERSKYFGDDKLVVRDYYTLPQEQARGSKNYSEDERSRE